MVLILDDQLRKSLRHIRRGQLQSLDDWPGAESILLAREVLCVRLGWGNASFVDLDGRVLFWNFAEGHPLEELTDPLSMACVVEWAAEIGFPELLDALPPMPAGGRTCDRCRGRRFTRRSAGAGQGSPRPVCTLCHGLGWLMDDTLRGD